MVAARLANMNPGYRSDLKPRPDLGKVVSVPEAAKLLSISRNLVVDGRTIRQHGTAEEIAAVETGEAAVTTTANTIRKCIIWHGAFRVYIAPMG